MIGVYIKGMEMPTRCKVCMFCGFGGRIGEFNVCMFTGESQPTLSQERMSSCSLVPVPPHGDLIDRREAERYALPRTEMVDGEIVQNKYVYLQTIQQLPTIIPADPAEEGET